MDCNSRCLKITDENGVSTCRKNGYNKLDIYDWLKDLPAANDNHDLLEIRFKNTRKGFYQNVNKMPLDVGDLVAVEASPGHDIGIVSLTGTLVMEQMKKTNVELKNGEFKKIYRRAKPSDIDKWREAIALEQETMISARQISTELKLEMKIGDVEYQGDKTKAIFYYIADERVDFRELIKVLAERFKIRIEMRQIGARQEAGRIGGIASCGREICCSTWMTNFVSVTTNSARLQELSLNPQKLAGQCGKLKCCLNYELDCYLDAGKNFPSTSIALETIEGTAYHQKTDIFKRIMWYSFDKDYAVNLTPVHVDRVKEIIALNKKGEKADKLVHIVPVEAGVNLDYANVVGEDDLNRFDTKKKSKNKKKNKTKGPRNDDRQQNGEGPQNQDSPQNQDRSKPQNQERSKNQERPQNQDRPKPQHQDRPKPQNQDRPQSQDRSQNQERSKPQNQDRPKPHEKEKPQIQDRSQGSPPNRPEQEPKEPKEPRENKGNRQSHGNRPNRGKRDHRNNIDLREKK